MTNHDITILLVDDEPDIVEIVRYNLSLEGFRVITANNGKKAVELAKKHKPQLILLDVMMPKVNGLEACKKIRSFPELSNILIAFLTARGEDYSQLAGFDAGADDYITKPIRPKVLVSRVKALLRRFREEGETSLEFDHLSIDKNEYKITVNEQEIDVPKKEFELLVLLASQPGKVFKREDILSEIWGSGVVVGDRTIDVHIRKLREKIGDEMIRTVKGVGYQFVS